MFALWMSTFFAIYDIGAGQSEFDRHIVFIGEWSGINYMNGVWKRNETMVEGEEDRGCKPDLAIHKIRDVWAASAVTLPSMNVVGLVVSTCS